jgi:glutamate-1-semialdehyde 2,1-aminomutase
MTETASFTSMRRAEQIASFVPGGSSTASKKALLMPDEPGVIVRGKGCRIWDADGREYIDFRNALGPVSLGYCVEEVDDAIRRQLASGISFGHPHPLEGEVAQMLSGIIPCAERVRFLKTGGEAIAAQIRLARHCTGRKHIIQIGYNGWLNSLSAGGRLDPRRISRDVPPGVTPELSALHHPCGWNDVAALQKLFKDHEGAVAAVVVAADYRDMPDGKTFYPELRRITGEHGALLIFDEIVTGFRIARGGVQEYFGVTPDLAVFAKGIANGMPLSAYVGKAEFMDRLDTVTVSSTYGGETLSLAAAAAVIRFYETHDVIRHLWDTGRLFWGGFAALLKARGIPAEIKGMPPVSFIFFDDNAEPGLAEKFYRALYRSGVSLYRGGYICYSHRQADIEEALERIEKGLQAL